MEEFQNNPRRKFLKELSGGLVLAGLGSLPLPSFGNDHVTKLTVLHTNDVHSHIDPFEDNDPKYPGMGGVARRSALIKKIRSEEKNVLLLDAGDIFQGTPYFNLYGGELEMKLMSKMGYDAGTLGNHDFDNGTDGLVKQMPHATFPFLNCNYETENTPLQGKLKPYQVFNRGGLRIGILGIGIELAGLVDPRLYGKVKYVDPVGQVSKISSYLKVRKKCDLVICLSHLGYQYQDSKLSDVELAKKSEHIDLIIGGHTHTFLNNPVKMLNSNDKEVLIAQAGWAGLRLGRIDFYFDKVSGKKLNETSSMIDLRKSSEN